MLSPHKLAAMRFPMILQSQLAGWYCLGAWAQNPSLIRKPLRANAWSSLQRSHPF